MKPYVLITGAYGGLGKAFAKCFARNGMNLVLLGRNAEKLSGLAREFDKTVDIITLQADVGDREQMREAARILKEKNIDIQVLINNAGITYIHRFDREYDLRTYEELIRTNLHGSVYSAYYFLDGIIRNAGSIINISSVIGYAPVIGRTAYAASKFGMEGFFRVLEAEHPDIHVMMVYPTFVDTGIRSGVEGDKTVNEILTPGAVACAVWKAYTRKKRSLFLGKTAYLSYLLYKSFPRLYIRLMRKKIEKTFDNKP